MAVRATRPFRAVGLDISENSANWLRIRRSIAGGSMKTRNGVRASRSKSAQRPERVQHVDGERFRAFARHDPFQLRGQLLVRLDEVDAPHHAVAIASPPETPSRSAARRAGNRSSRAGAWAARGAGRAPASPTPSRPGCLRCARYLLKFRRSAVSSRRISASPASRTSELESGWPASASPRKANGDRNRWSAGFHDPSYSSSRIAFQFLARGIRRFPE